MKERSMAKGKYNLQMAPPTRVNSTRMISMAKVCTSGQITNPMTENGYTTKCMEKAQSNGLMVRFKITYDR
jgi:hypothetical protein